MRRFWLKHVLGRVKLGIRYVVSFSLPPAYQKRWPASCIAINFPSCMDSAELCGLGTRDVGQIDMRRSNTTGNQPTRRRRVPV